MASAATILAIICGVGNADKSQLLQRQQDRRWNADKPSAALDPYMPTWLTTSPANHRPANFWFFFKHWNEIVKSGATSGPADEHQH